MCSPSPAQLTVPTAGPWQYWSRIFPQVSSGPCRPSKNDWRASLAPAGSDDHCEPQNTRNTFGLVATTPSAPFECRYTSDGSMHLPVDTPVGVAGLTPTGESTEKISGS